jgi:hypothetical protein
VDADGGKAQSFHNRFKYHRIILPFSNTVLHTTPLGTDTLLSIYFVLIRYVGNVLSPTPNEPHPTALEPHQVRTIRLIPLFQNTALATRKEVQTVYILILRTK